MYYDVYSGWGDGVEAWDLAGTLIGRTMVEGGVANVVLVEMVRFSCAMSRDCGGSSWGGIQLNIINPKFQVTNITTTTLIVRPAMPT
jgi:hypothetical protein